jgi:hypothetical protein
LILTNGVSIATYGTASLITENNVSIISEGRPLQLNRLVRYETVQEQPAIWGATGSTMKMLSLGTDLATVTFRFTEISHLANTEARRRFLADLPTNVLIRDCSFADSSITLRTSGLTGYSILLANNLFERCLVDINQDYYDDYVGYPVNFNMRNNLFRYCTLTFYYYDSNFPFYANNNLFHSSTIWEGGPLSFFASQNGYFDTPSVLSGDYQDQTISTADYQIGIQGRYYYPNSGANLFAMVNNGSESVANAGLYHYTVRTDHAKDSGAVDIGYHFMAIGANGEPLDSDGDGIPDYLEDKNGNGIAESNESAWNYAMNGAGGLAVFTPLKK